MMIRILIVEDSMVMAGLLKAVLEQEPDMEVIGHAKDGKEAVEMAMRLRPTLITMDIRMPVMDGFEATRQIMAQCATPIVVVSSSVNDSELQITFRAIEEGALAVVEKPHGFSGPYFEPSRQELVETVRGMAEVRVISRRYRREADHALKSMGLPLPAKRNFDLLAIGCSTGGPQALHLLLSQLPADLPLPVVVAQHISAGFIGGLIKWLDDSSPLTVKLAQSGLPLEAGVVYFAPDDHHLKVARQQGKVCARLDQGPAIDGFRPSATPLLESVAQTCPGHAIGALLTGMGADGARGLLAMRDAGCVTFVQDEASSVVFGMPAAALALNAAEVTVALDAMPDYLKRLLAGSR